LSVDGYRKLRIDAGYVQDLSIVKKIGMHLGHAIGTDLPICGCTHGERLYRFIGRESHGFLARRAGEDEDLKVPILVDHGLGTSACRAA
jgi:hypothetical protein